jgi:prolyl oligopeptidase
MAPMAGCSRAKAPASSSIAPPPATRVTPVTETLHGVAVSDDYRWLEGDNTDPRNPGRMTPEVSAWTDSQGRYTRSVLDALPDRSAWASRLGRLQDTGDVTMPSVRNNRYFYSVRNLGDPDVAILTRDGYLGTDRELLRTAAADPNGLLRITWIAPSPDGKLLAYGAYRGGNRDAVLSLMEVDTRKTLPLEIHGSPQPPQWLPDGSGFVYQHLGNPADPTSNWIRYHKMGADPAKDPILHRQATARESPELSRTWGPFGTLSRDGKWFLAGYWISPTRTDSWLISMEDFLRTGRAQLRVVSAGVEGRASGTVIGGTLYLHTTKEAPNGRVVAVAVTDPSQAHWRVIVPERKDAEIQAVAFGRGSIVVTYLTAGSNVTEVFDLAGKSLGVIAQPGIGTTLLSATEDRTEAFMSFQSFNRPPTMYRVDLASPSSAPAQWKTLPVQLGNTAVEVEQVHYPSRDGTDVSMFLIHRKGLTPTGDTPVLVTANGALGARMTPVFSATLFPWFEAGGMMAVPLVRGGSEFGMTWRAAGVREHKQASADDLVAAADWLIAKRYTNSQKLAFFGSGGGALLGGMALTQRPDLFRVMVLLNPITDMLRFHRFLQGPFWVPEFGSPDDATQFGWLNAYSPYQHVKTGVTYPAVFIAGDERAPDVHAMHARKLAARLQAVNPNPAARPVLVWIERDVTLSPDEARANELRAQVDQWSFIASQLGVRLGN